MSEQTTIYRYGLLAWFWRAMIAGFLFGGAICLIAGARHGHAGLFVMAVVLLAPALFFGAVVAVQVDRLDDDQIRISTLLFWQRYVRRERLGTARVRKIYHGETGPMYAPRLWVRVSGGLPIYFDLLAKIPDRKAFAETFRVPVARL